MIGINKIISRSPVETIIFGRDFAKTLERGDVVGLFGNLGSGKTQFVKGICEYFDVKDPINSPTFILANEYRGTDQKSGTNLQINHLDLYRLENMEQLIGMGIENYVSNNSICLIEWAELADEYLGGNLKKLNFEHGNEENERFIKRA